MDKEQLKEIKRIANEIKPQFNIGKNGITDTFIETIDKYLDAHHIVKIKSMIAKDKSEINETARIISNKTDSEILSKKGFTFVLYRE